MRKPLLILLAVAVVAAVAGLGVHWLAQEPAATGLPPIHGAVAKFVLAAEPVPAPAIPWKDEAGGEQRMADYRGKVVLVNYWATWCAPCVREMPALARLQAVLPASDFALLAINVDLEGQRVARPFLVENDLLALGLHLDNRGTVARAMGVTVMPTTILFDREGREVWRLSGAAEWDSAEAQALIRHVIDRKPGGA